MGKGLLNLKGVIELQGSKSLAQRMLIISTYLQGNLSVGNFPLCLDALNLLNNLKRTGLRCSFNNSRLEINPWSKYPEGSRFAIHDSATAYRFLTVRLAMIKGLNYSIAASKQLFCRPHQHLVELLDQLNCNVEVYPQKREIFVTSHYNRPTHLTVDTSITSHYLSSILLCAPSFFNGLQINTKGTHVSESYIDLTIRLMSKFGLIVRRSNNKFLLFSESNYVNPKSIDIEPDLSLASFYWSIGALSNYAVGIKCVKKDSIQYEIKYMDVLKEYGSNIMQQGECLSVSGKRRMGINVDMNRLPDQVPLMAVLALFSNKPSIIRNISHLKYKESDRISCLIKELNKLGNVLSYENGNLHINPLQNRPGQVFLNTYNDHRLVMAFTLLKYVLQSIDFGPKHCINKSYPNFFKDQRKLFVDQMRNF